MGRSSPKAVRTSRSATWSGLRPSRRVCPWLRRAFPLTYVPSRTTIVATTSAIRGISTDALSEDFYQEKRPSKPLGERKKNDTN